MSSRWPRALAAQVVRRGGARWGSVVGVRTQEPLFVPTFDDGPEPGGTEDVLAALAQSRTTATFFVLLSRAQLYPSLLADIVAEGHEVALHGRDHRRLTGLPLAEVADRMAVDRAALQDRTGQQVRWFRPPYGALTFSIARTVRAAGMQPVLWGPTSWDWRDIGADEQVDKAMVGSGRGAILLCHDGIADHRDGVDDGPPPNVARGDLVRRILDRYAANGLSGQSLSSVSATGRMRRSAVFSS